jgi:hypothetical protein
LHKQLGLLKGKTFRLIAAIESFQIALAGERKDG